MNQKKVALFAICIVFALMSSVYAQNLNHSIGAFGTAEIVMQDDDDISYLGLGLNYQMGIYKYLAMNTQSTLSFHHKNAITGLQADMRVGRFDRQPSYFPYIGLGFYGASIFTEGKDTELDYGLAIPVGSRYRWDRFVLDGFLVVHKSLSSAGVNQYYGCGIGIFYDLK